MKKLYSLIMVLLICSINMFAQGIQTATFTKVTSTSALAEGDIIVFAYEPAGAVCGPLNNTFLTALTDNVKFSGNTVEVPDAAQTFTISKYNGKWQFTETNTGNRILLDVSGKGAFCYGEPDDEHLAGWSISFEDGDARVGRGSDGTFPVLFNTNPNSYRFKPYLSESAGVLPSLYKKTGEFHPAESKIILAQDINLGTVETGETAEVEVAYTAEYLTDEIVWSVGGTDAAYFTIKDEGDNQSGSIKVAYNGKATKTGTLDAKVEYLSANAANALFEGSFPISINLVANTVKLTSLAFDESDKSVYLGETLDLGKQVIFTPANAADKSLTWTTSNQYRATVDENGVVTPLISGDVTITATSVRVPDVSASCVVTIKVPAATGINVEPSTIDLSIGGKQTLTVSVLPAEAKQDVTFASDNTGVATVSSKGVVTAKALGTAVITIATKENENIKTTCTVNVVPQTVESISFNPAQVTVTKGFTLQLEPVITPASAADDNAVTYKSDNDKVASVDANGVVTGVEVGQTAITATCAGKEAKVTVSVVEADMFTKVTDPASLKNKDTIIIAVSGIYGETAYNVVAGPLTEKQLKALKDNVTITENSATAEGALRLVLETATGGFRLVPVGKTKGLAENGNAFYEQNTKNNSVWKFEADDKGVYIRNVGNTDAYVKYNPDNSYIRPYKLGSVGPVMMYTYVRPYKEPEPAKVTGVTLNKATLELGIGATEKLTATVAPKDAKNKSVTWSSSDEDIATVSSTGEVTAVAEGTATITVTTVEGGFTATCEVTVLPPVKVTGVSLNKAELTLETGQSSKLTATVTPDDAADKSVTWSSSAEDVATVDGGTVTAISEGTATITATTVDGGFTATCTVTVKPGTPIVGGKGEKGNPYTIEEVKALESSSAKVWVIGYIWGQPASGSSLKSSPADDTNMALGDTPDSDGSSFVPVELPKGDIRNELGLSTNPENIGRRIKVYGTIEKYFGVVGVKKVTEYVWADGTAPTEPTPVPVFSIEGGDVPSGAELVIRADEPTDALFYSLNRGPWQQTVGEATLVIDREVTVSAYALREGYLESETVQFTFTITTDGIENVFINGDADANGGNGVRKLLRSGHVVIVLPDGREFDVTGTLNTKL